MTNDGWGKEWPKITDTWVNSKVWEDGVNKAFDKEFLSKLEGEWPIPLIEKQASYNLATHLTNIPKVYSNKMPTHDPYTNPDSQIYYQCNCGAILDPGTKKLCIVE